MGFRHHDRLQLVFIILTIQYAGCVSNVKYPELQDREWLCEQYVVRERTISDIAGVLGCSNSNVSLSLKRHGIEARPRLDQRRLAKYKIRACRGCQQVFQPTATCQPYCGECRPPHVSRPKPRHKCAFCEEFFRPKPRKFTYYSKEFCSAEHRLAFLARNGGKAERRLPKDGYIEFRVGEGYPGARANGYMAEHRWVMEQRLGRRLYRHEEVHHRNGQRDDNDRCMRCPAGTMPPVVLGAGEGARLYCEACGWQGPKPNLELWSRSQPHGQRVEDKIEWARWFLGQYSLRLLSFRYIICRVAENGGRLASPVRLDQRKGPTCSRSGRATAGCWPPPRC